MGNCMLNTASCKTSDPECWDLLAEKPKFSIRDVSSPHTKDAKLSAAQLETLVPNSKSSPLTQALTGIQKVRSHRVQIPQLAAGIPSVPAQIHCTTTCTRPVGPCCVISISEDTQ